jgi:signal transduction histidine kinase
VVIDADGRFRGSFAVVSDITERKRAEQDQTRLRRRLEALWGIARLTETDYNTLCDQILLEIMDMTQSAYAFYGSLNEDESEMSVYAWSKEALKDCQMHEKPLKFTISDAGLWGDAVRERRTIIINDCQAEHPSKKGVPEGHVSLTRIMAVPIFNHDRVVALAVVANKPFDYDEEDSRQIEGFVSNGQVILDRRKIEESLVQSQKELRLLSSQLLTVQEAERKRIAGEIHDSLGQSLTTIKFGLEGALRQPDKETPAAAGLPSLNTLLPVVQQAIEEVRRLQSDLRPPMLDDLGILATLEWFCRRNQAIHTGITIKRQIHIKEDEVPDLLKTVIYRLLQEAMNNVVRHSRADRVDLHLAKTHGVIELSVRDNGIGFDVEKTKRGMGLVSMRERTEHSGGSFSVESKKGKETTIRASWSAEEQTSPVD